MFQVNDVIIYGSQGVCEIAAIEEKSISGVKKAYFVLKPVKDPGSTIYAPTDNALVRKKMRRLLTVSEINHLIDSMPDEKTVWIDNVNERKECYKKLLASGDHTALIQMIKAIYAHKKEREAAGKRLHMMDEHFFKDAEQILYNEFQYVLNLSGKDALMQYILERIGNGSKSQTRHRIWTSFPPILCLSSVIGLAAFRLTGDGIPLARNWMQRSAQGKKPFHR